MLTENELKALADEGYNRIAVVEQCLADLDTPLSIYLKLAKEDRLNAENKMERFYKNRGDAPASDAEHPLDQKPCASA